MKFGGKVLNMYYSRFTVETSGYDSPRTTLRVLEEDPSILAKKLSLGSAYLQLQVTSRRPIDLV